MADIKTIKIFLASSEELADERIKFGDFIRTLDDTYEQRGFHIKLIKWEDLPKGDDGRPTQETYNEHVRECDLFVSLFYTKAGKYTLEEYDVAKKTQSECGKPTIYVFLRKLKDGEKAEKSLVDFKKNKLKAKKIYAIDYESSDALQLKFVLDLLKVENKRLDELKVENGIINWGNIPIAHMANLSFAAGNKDYQRMSQRLQELPSDIEKLRKRVEKYPDEEDFKQELQSKLNEYNRLKDEFKKQQEYLFDTAKRIAQQQGETITDSIRRASEAFESGDVAKANAILDEAKRHGDQVYEEFLIHEELQQQRRQNVHNTIEELLLQTSTVMADVAVPIKDRIEKTLYLYQEADERAAHSDYDKTKYAQLLFDYAQFLDKYGKYQDAENVYLRQIALSEELYGSDSTDTATSYNNIGAVYNSLGNYPKALEFYLKDLAICEKVLGKEHPDTATSYNNIGLVYDNQGDYTKALEFYLKALAIYEKVLGKEHPDTATLYNNIGLVYDSQGDYTKALEFYFKALEIEEKVLGKEHPSTATSYNNIAATFFYQEKYQESLEYFTKALHICENKLGPDHPDTRDTQKSIAIVQGYLQ